MWFRRRRNGENLTVEWFLPPAWIFAPYYYGPKTHRGRHFPKRRPRLDEPGRARRGCDRNAPCRNRTLRRNSAAAGSVFRLCMRMTTSSLWINPLIRRFIRRLEIMKIRWQTALHGIFEQKGEPFVYRCINRLDRDTTGLIVLAKHALSAAVLSQAMRSRRNPPHVSGLRPRRNQLHPAPSTPRSPASTAPSSSAPSTLPPASAVTHYRTLAHCSVFSPPRTQPRNRPHPPDPRPHGLHRPSAARRYPLQQNSRHFPPPGTSLCIALLCPSDHRRTLKLPRSTAGRYAKPADITNPRELPLTGVLLSLMELSCLFAGDIISYTKFSFNHYFHTVLILGTSSICKYLLMHFTITS